MIHYSKRYLLLGLLFFSAICHVKANRHYIFAFDVAYADRGCINTISSANMISVVQAVLEKDLPTDEKFFTERFDVQLHCEQQRNACHHLEPDGYTSVQSVYWREWDIKDILTLTDVQEPVRS